MAAKKQQDKQKQSVKRQLVTKANQRIVVLTGVAGFFLVFALVATSTLVKQISYQNRVISARKDALSVANTNVSNVKQLLTQYNAFVDVPQNFLGGSSTGNGNGNGSNAQLILNALPSRYDFPALTASLEYLAERNGLTLQAITGTDDEVAQQPNATSTTPAPVEMPFTLSVKGSFQGIQALINDFEHSIRPFQVQSFSYAEAGDGTWTAQVVAKTFYQPGKSLNAREEPVQ